MPKANQLTWVTKLGFDKFLVSKETNVIFFKSFITASQFMIEAFLRWIEISQGHKVNILE